MLFALAIVRADYVPRIVLEIFFNNGRRLSSLEITIGWSSVMTSERIFIFGFCDRCWTVEEENVRSSIRERYHYLQRFFLFTQKQCSQSQTYTVVDTHFSTHTHTDMQTDTAMILIPSMPIQMCSSTHCVLGEWAQMHAFQHTHEDNMYACRHAVTCMFKQEFMLKHWCKHPDIYMNIYACIYAYAHSYIQL